MPMRPIRGFSLVELSIVLLIVALLGAGLLLPLAAQREQQHLNETRLALEDIRHALLGHAVIYGFLPCPSTVSDPANSSYGVAPTGCNSAPSTEGRLPWKTLGVTETDGWGNYWRYRVDRNFAGAAITLSTNFSADALSIRDSAGNIQTTTTERPLAIIYSAGQNSQPDGHNSNFEPSSGIYQNDDVSPDFDDQLIWLSRPQLYERLVAAGRLP